MPEEAIAEPQTDTIAIRAIRTCPDCGASGAGNYCANCGEEMEPYLPKVRQFLAELAGEFVSFDSKVVRTIPALLFRPGFLTNEYRAGRRKKYLLPSRLYFLLAVLCFFVLRTSLHNLHLSTGHQGLNVSFQYTTEPNSIKTGSNSKSTTATDPAVSAQEQVLSNYFMEVTPYVLLLISTPLFALILKWLYGKKKVLYIGHLIFSFHFFTFAIIVFSLAGILGYFDGFIVAIAFFLLYLYLALRTVYANRGWQLIGRFLASSVAYLLLSFVGITVSLGVTYEIARWLGSVPN